MKKFACILAAGKGTRMNSDLPKCAVPLNGKPMINYVVDACLEAGIDEICVIVGYKKEQIIECLKDYKNVYTCEQVNQLGTGDAVKAGAPFLRGKEGTTIILAGDTPLIGSENIKNLIDFHEENNCTVTILSCIFDNPFSYGRIVRNESGNVCAIVEEKEASDEIKAIKEVNSGLYAVDNIKLFEALDQVKNDNVKGEYYLTDIVKILSPNFKVDTKVSVNDYHLTGINDMNTLKEVEKLLLEELIK